MGGRGSNYSNGGSIKRMSTNNLLQVSNKGWLPNGKAATKSQIREANKILTRRGKNTEEVIPF